VNQRIIFLCCLILGCALAVPQAAGEKRMTASGEPGAVVSPAAAEGTAGTVEPGGGLESRPGRQRPERRGVLWFWLVFSLLLALDLLFSRVYIHVRLRRGRRRGRPVKLRDLKASFILQLPLFVLIMLVSLLASQAAAGVQLFPSSAETAAGTQRSARLENDRPTGRTKAAGGAGAVVRGEPEAAAAETHRLQALKSLAADNVQKLNKIWRRLISGSPGGKVHRIPWHTRLREAEERNYREDEALTATAIGIAAGKPERASQVASVASEASEASPARVSVAGLTEDAITPADGLPPRERQPPARKAADPPPPAKPIAKPIAKPPAPAAAARVAAAVADPPPAAVPQQSPEQVLEEPGRLVTVAPGDTPDYFAADILFIHAHPDDESLDFGVLMARSDAAGLKTVTVLFTDGEAGIDRFPRRRVDTEYPGRRLRGAELAALRVREAQQALSVLGCRVYVRLGLPNHPYNSQVDRLAVGEVLRTWGGEERLAAGLADIIRGYQPRIVVGPDQHSAAREHFEHEAVGYILRRALEKLAAAGSAFPRGVLTCVDPRQKSRYLNLIAVPVEQNESGQRQSFRDIQLRALRKHVSQQDAVLAMNFLPRYREEYYLPLRWETELPLPVAFGD
jgi:LmbE family N-acetylglucosaminyl deacetylase